MEFSGLIKAYPTKRYLTQNERKFQLHQKKRIELTPYYQLSVTEMNSTYLESVDKWFGWKGILTILATFLFAFAFCSFGFIGAVFLLEAENIIDPRFSDHLSKGAAIANGLAMWGLFGITFWIALWLLKKDSFAYTHYPIRFNRKTRIVSVFRTDGSTLSVRWDDIFFTLSRFENSSDWEIRGHVLDTDKSTVLETFALSYLGMIYETDVLASKVSVSQPDYVRGHWEFIRRYMEDGPHAIHEQVKLCMPVNYRKETARESFERAFANFTALPGPIFSIFIPLFALISVFRIIGMRTSKIPKWSEDIERENVIEENDPYAIRGGLMGKREALYPDASRR